MRSTLRPWSAYEVVAYSLAKHLIQAGQLLEY